MKIQVTAGDSTAIECVFCLDELTEPLRVCDACRVAVHVACAEEMPRCSTLGCQGSFVAPGILAESARDTAASSGDTAASSGDTAASSGDTAASSVGAGFTPARDSEPGPQTPTETEPSSRPWLRRALAVPLAVVLLGWLTTFSSAPGQDAQLGGWFHGHGGTLAAVGWTYGLASEESLVEVESVAYSPDGVQLASLDDDRELIVWEAATGRVVREQTLPFAPVFGWAHWVGFAPDRPVALAAIGTYLDELNLETGELREISVGNHVSLSLNDPDLLAAWAGSDGKVLLAYTSDDPTFTVAAIDPSVDGGKPWRLASGTPAQRYVTAAIAPSGLHAAAAYEGQIDLWQLRAGRVTTLGLEIRLEVGAVNALSFSPDGTVLAWVEGGNTLVLWDLPAGRVLAMHEFSGEPGWDSRFSPDGQQVAVWGLDLRLIDTDSGQVFNHPTWDDGRRIYGVAFSPGGSRIATADADQAVRLWSLPQ